jgi:serine/threonine protein kinase
MGVVYQAVDTRTGSTVALKSLPKADPSALYRFKQELRSLSDISYPNPWSRLPRLKAPS